MMQWHQSLIGTLCDNVDSCSSLVVCKHHYAWTHYGWPKPYVLWLDMSLDTAHHDCRTTTTTAQMGWTNSSSEAPELLLPLNTCIMFVLLPHLILVAIYDSSDQGYVLKCSKLL